jgi:hypothetical protein
MRFTTFSGLVVSATYLSHFFIATAFGPNPHSTHFSPRPIPIQVPTDTEFIKARESIKHNYCQMESFAFAKRNFSAQLFSRHFQLKRRTEVSGSRQIREGKKPKVQRRRRKAKLLFPFMRSFIAFCKKFTRSAST